MQGAACRAHMSCAMLEHGISKAWSKLGGLQNFSRVSWWLSSAAPFSSGGKNIDALPRALLDDIMACSLRKQTGVSLRYILDFGTQPLNRQMVLSAKFLHQELPIRLAHRIAELNNLPPALSANRNVKRVKWWYAESFREMREFPAVKDAQDAAKFTQMLQHAYSRHNAVVPAIAKGLEEYKRATDPYGSGQSDLDEELTAFLDRFFLSRIALRFLAGNHVALFEQARLPPERRSQDQIGLIHTRCSPLQVVSDAVQDARDVCIRTRGDAPHVNIKGSPRLTLPYVPSHLHHMVFELVKNSLRAVAERYDGGDTEPPDVQVVVATGREDVTIKISDMGGGISRAGVKRMWNYLYTTARSPLPDLDPDDESYVALPAVLAGYGCGLPLSRLYARYFGGDLQLFSMQGYGTDAFLHLSRLGSTEEPMPGQK